MFISSPSQSSLLGKFKTNFEPLILNNRFINVLKSRFWTTDLKQKIWFRNQCLKKTKMLQSLVCWNNVTWQVLKRALNQWFYTKDTLMFRNSLIWQPCLLKSCDLASLKQALNVWFETKSFMKQCFKSTHHYRDYNTISPNTLKTALWGLSCFVFVQRVDHVTCRPDTLAPDPMKQNTLCMSYLLGEWVVSII